MSSPQFSVVIIAAEPSASLMRTLTAAALLTTDVVLVFSGNAAALVQLNDTGLCRAIGRRWRGYGAAKNAGATAAKSDWILSLDADEVPDRRLSAALADIPFPEPAIAYDIRFSPRIGHRRIRYGTWGRDHHVRLYNRTTASWSDDPVHERLLLAPRARIVRLPGRIDHYTAADLPSYRDKALGYARLRAQNYFETQRYNAFGLLAPAFHFVKSYLLFAGFLDGKLGFQLACIAFGQCRLKYRELERFRREYVERSATTAFNLKPKWSRS